MKKLLKWVIIILCVISSLWFGVPLGITYYINHKYNPEIIVDKVSIVGFGCIKLDNIKITKPNVSGNITSAIGCYRHKTIDVHGGSLNVSIVKSSTTSVQNTNGFMITGKGLSIHIIHDKESADLYNTTISQKNICADKVIAFHPKADAIIFNLCFDRENNSVSASNGSISPKIEYKGYSLESIEFQNLTKATKTEISVGQVRYVDSSISNLHVTIKDYIANIGIGSLELVHKRLFRKKVTINNVKVDNIHLQSLLSSKPIITFDNKVIVNLDLEKQQIFGNDDCQNWLDIVPEELKDGPISQMRIKGTFGFDIKLNPVSLKINSKCSIDGPTPPFINALKKPFKYTAYRPDGTPFERTSGPNTIDWIPLNFIDHMATALTITEDPGFWHHRGIIPQALENSLKEDIRKGKFFRGGSTITMQLAKNLWLTRNKSLGRKLQEGILTIALESCLSKEQILELYLNVVEFGPNTYGIGPGCAKFLKKYPGEISISEALYMATRLPSPNKAYSYEANKGFIKKLIAIGVASGKISEQDLVELQTTPYSSEENEDYDY
jgi:hypothetical protein